VCADLLDYLQRDALYCGLALRYDERLFQLFHLTDGKLAIRLHKDGGLRRDALSELIHLLQMRYALTERVYYHHAKTVAGAMVSRALELALEAGAVAREDLYQLRDDSLLDRLSIAAGAIPGLKDVTDDLAARRLYKRAYLLAPAGLGRPGLSPTDLQQLADLYHHSPQRRRLVERQFADRFRIPESHVIVYCPSPRMALKEADVLVQVAPGELQPLAGLGHPDVAGLQEKHAGIWKFFVCLRRDHESRFDEAGALCTELFGHPNQIEPRHFKL
jgi:HD superfamily phosphohydrolase